MVSAVQALLYIHGTVEGIFEVARFLPVAPKISLRSRDWWVTHPPTPTLGVEKVWYNMGLAPQPSRHVPSSWHD